MYSSSSALKTAILTDHIVISKAEVWASDQKLQEINISEGTVQVDARSAVRRTCEITLVTDRETTNLVPDNDFDLLTPFGNELRLYRGVQYSDGTEEYVPLGVFVIIEVAISDTNDGVKIQLKGEDRSIRISRAKFTSPYQMTAGTLESSLTALLRNRYPDVETAFPTTNVSITNIVLGTEQDNDPWKDAVEIAELVGFDLYFDQNGVARMNQFPTLDGSVVVATFVEGSGTTVTSLNRTISTKSTYNGVIYTIEGTEVTTPIRVEVWDEDPASPTYRSGVFGEVPVFIETSLVATQAEAVSAATSLLNIYVGSQEVINWESLVDPTLDAQDVVYVKSNGSKVDRLVIIDSIDIPLTPQGSMSANARTVRVVSTGEQVLIGAG
jgi:hypothetical protein